MRSSRFSFVSLFVLALIGGLGCAHQAPPPATLAPTRSVPVVTPKELDPYAEMFNGFVETASHELNELRNCNNSSMADEVQQIKTRLDAATAVIMREKSLKNIDEPQLRADVDEVMMIKVLMAFGTCSDIHIVHVTPDQ